MPVATGEIRQAVLERGELTKKEILLLWGLGDDEYATLRAELAADREIEPGSTRTGGFRVRQKRWRLPPETEQPPAAELPVEPWQRRGAERLAATLRVAQLDALLGRKLANALRLDRKRRTGRDAPSRLDELAHALVVKHDRDLFADPAVRAAVAKACGVPRSRSGIPGRPPPPCSSAPSTSRWSSPDCRPTRRRRRSSISKAASPCRRSRTSSARCGTRCSAGLPPPASAPSSPCRPAPARPGPPSRPFATG